MKNGNITDKMIPAFQKSNGGLFSESQKADIGDAVVKMQQQGIALMSWADPFSPSNSTPSIVAQTTAEAILNGVGGHYTAPVGNSELKVELAKRLESYNGLKVEPLRNILISPGSDTGLYFAMLPFIKPGDEVMIVDPSYPNNYTNTEIMGGVVVKIPSCAEDGWQIDVKEFEKRLTDKTKMVVLTNPNNPTTAVYRRDRMEALAEFIIKNDLICVVDQAFEEPVFDGVEMVTMASLPGMWERTVTVFSFSKGMGLSGYRVGYIVASDEIMDKMYGLAVSVLGATSTASQLGAIAALRNNEFTAEFNRIHAERRDFVYDKLHDIPGVYMQKSESGFLSWLDISALGTEGEIVEYLVQNAKVSVNSGAPYGENGKGHIRIVHGVLGTEQEFCDAIERIRAALLKRAAEKGLV